MIALLSLLVLAPVDSGAVEIDAFFHDWQGHAEHRFEHLVKGDLAGPGDLGGTVQIAYGGDALYVAAQVQDDAFREGAGGDRLTLVFAPSGGAVRRVEVALNELEGARPATLTLDGRPVPGARIASTTRKDGWAVEFALPLKALPGATTGPLGFAAVVTDADPGSGPAVLSTARLDGRGAPPPNLRLDPMAGLFEQYLAERGAAATEHARRRADVDGDGTPEEVVVNSADVVVLGRGLPGGAIYVYFTHAWIEGTRLEKLEARDLDGRPGEELVLHWTTWLTPDEVRAEILEVYGVSDGFLKRMYAQKLVEDRVSAKADLRSTLRFLAPKTRGGSWRIGVSPARVRGLTLETFEPTELQGSRAYEPIPLPWVQKTEVLYDLVGDVWQRK